MGSIRRIRWKAKPSLRKAPVSPPGWSSPVRTVWCAPTRGADGKFLRGWKGGTGRPAGFVAEKEKFAARMRFELRHRKLVPERMAAMAAGEGEWADLPPALQHQIVMDMLSYAYGKPTVINVVDNSETNVTLIKRVIGV